DDMMSCEAISGMTTRSEPGAVNHESGSTDPQLMPALFRSENSWNQRCMPPQGMTPPALIAPAFSPVAPSYDAHDAPVYTPRIPRDATAGLWAVVLAGGWGIRLRPLTRLI